MSTLARLFPSLRQDCLRSLAQDVLVDEWVHQQFFRSWALLVVDSEATANESVELR